MSHHSSIRMISLGLALVATLATWTSVDLLAGRPLADPGLAQAQPTTASAQVVVISARRDAHS